MPQSSEPSPAALHEPSPGAPRAAVYQPFSRKGILLGVTGSIAAFKAASIARLLVKAGADVQVLLTRAATEFIGPATFSGITGNPVMSDVFDPSVAGEPHVDAAAHATAMVIAPATADLLARLATGRADDVLTATALCLRAPLLLAPAMHPAMWTHPATQRNVAQLVGDGRVTLIGPVHGEVASGESGFGRMAEPEAVLAALAAALTPKDLAGRHVVVTAGPTVEDLDPVRFLTNRSSGLMGFAVAARAAARGARVTLVAGPVTLQTPPGVERVDVRSAVEMQAALAEVVGLDAEPARCDAVIMAAAVGDYRPAHSSTEKRKRSSEPLHLELHPNPDLLAGLAAQRKSSRPLLVGFAVETCSREELVAEARRKLTQKRVDMIVANRAADSFGRHTNVAWLVEDARVEVLPELPKEEVAERILGWLTRRLGELGSWRGSH